MSSADQSTALVKDGTILHVKDMSKCKLLKGEGGITSPFLTLNKKKEKFTKQMKCVKINRNHVKLCQNHLMKVCSLSTLQSISLT